MIKKILSLLLFFYTLIGFSQNPALNESTSVSIFTCGRGNELYTTFGHTAIRIKDTINQLDVVYNYGAFDFRTPNFYLKFVKGDLQYFINASSYEDFIFEYQSENREVVEQTLNLPLVKKQELFDLLNVSLYSDERYYTYKFIDRNCTTMVQEKINKILGENLVQKVDDTSISYRKLLYPYFDNHFWYKFGINLIFGAKTDAQAVKLFLPSELMHSLDKVSIKGKPLVSKSEIIVKGAPLESEFSFVNSIYFVALILLIIVVLNNKYVTFTYLFAIGLFGLFLSLVGFYSLHKEISWNYNALLFNPLFLVLPFLKKEWFKKTILICSIMLLLYCIVIITKPHLLLMLPFLLANSYFLFKFYKKTKKEV
ncbi:DUF4105 domain-containing protein [Flavobacterium sp. SUN052]|uniref:lipoprotein N-acyltransferase Lnb domain-containing protein n=1 Tax=Flavobacterium sp. SUN052 TaxID=3002441 RepID=UPI00237E139C|nr:DUF4105 domain-containing protein [Flavobacterium sp. SUN052]MEC4004383.1 DUF4105 domain-containing protein [Flavobacterium sp. SUN052]